MTRALTSVGIVGLSICLTVAGCASIDGRGFLNQTPTANTVASGFADCTPIPAPVVIMDIGPGTAPSTLSMTISQGSVGIRWKGNAVKWILTGALAGNYEFAAMGISMKDGSQGVSYVPGATEFDWCFPETTKNTTWNYNINIKRKSDQTNWTCDPTVVSSNTGIMSPRPFALAKLTCVPAK